MLGGGLVAKSYPTLGTPWTVAHQAPLSMGFSRQEYWSGLPFSSAGDLLVQESNPGLRHCWQILRQLSYEGSSVPTREAQWGYVCKYRFSITFSSVQFSCSVVSNSLWPHELQHARPPCPSPAPGVQSDSRPSSQWCHPAISSSVVPFSSCSQSLLASESSNESTLHMRCPKYWSFSFSIIPSKEIPGLISFRMDWLDLLVLCIC